MGIRNSSQSTLSVSEGSEFLLVSGPYFTYQEPEAKRYGHELKCLRPTGHVMEHTGCPISSPTVSLLPPAFEDVMH